ncbi:glycosyltransferase domain-containing protein [Defluviimonas sp. SAOS-178_SWC]|uniref:glycosyltransferase domain-containing protein n=1 Tax=Defluviimonas sp. SAOS-178_SWC TaxID=3121287 RepID=UPI0032219BD6
MSLVLYSARYGTADPLNPDVFGGYENCRRVLFTDRADLVLPRVEVIHDPLDGLDPARASRRAKLMPHRYFPEAEHSIWIDNKSRLTRDPEEILAALERQSDAAFLAFPHFRRDCVYQELQTCREGGLDDHATLKERERTYRAEQMPEHFGLIEGHFIVRRHNDPDIVRFGERWFEHVLRFSRRDQISFPYLAWKLDLRYDLITALDWKETVEFTVFDRKTRRPDFPRRNVLYQEARRLYHRMRGDRRC